jgi:pimeloyl-ACP methyl ester carboxylesterase
MRKLLIVLLLNSLFISCRPYKSTIEKPNQMTYSNFRTSQKSFNSKDGIMKYIDKGQGDVILLLHGVPTSSWLYRKMIDDLAKNHRVIAPDMLGFGNSDSPNGYDVYSEENHAVRLLELMTSLNIENWTHVMHDAGGLWTWELIKKDASRINKLVMLNTVVYEEGFKPPIRFNEGITAKVAMWAYRNGITTNMMLNGLFKAGLTKNNLNKLDVEGYKTPLREGKTRAMYYFFSQTCNTLPVYESILKELDLPVLVIWGKADDFLKWEPQKERVIQDLNIPAENIHLIDAKHFIQEEKPEEISKLILDFID